MRHNFRRRLSTSPAPPAGPAMTDRRRRVLFAAAWLAERPGEVRIDWLGWRLETSAAVLLLIVLALAPSTPRPAARRALFDFRPALRNAAVRPYMFASFAHSWELHGTRAWLVAFLTFAAGGATDSVPGGVALTAALILLLGPIASVSGNELALRYGRARIMTIGAAGSGLLSLVFGFTAGLPWLGLLVFAVVHMYFIGIDAGALTAGAASSAPPSRFSRRSISSAAVAASTT